MSKDKVTLSLDNKVAKRLKDSSRASDKSQSEIAEQAIDSYLDRVEGEAEVDPATIIEQQAKYAQAMGSRRSSGGQSAEKLFQGNDSVRRSYEESQHSELPGDKVAEESSSSMLPGDEAEGE